MHTILPCGIIWGTICLRWLSIGCGVSTWPRRMGGTCSFVNGGLDLAEGTGRDSGGISEKLRDLQSFDGYLPTMTDTTNIIKVMTMAKAVRVFVFRFFFIIPKRRL